MMTFSERVNKISNHKINSNEDLEWRISEYNSLLHYCQNIVTENELDDFFLENASKFLKEVFAFGYELGSKKATEMIAGDYHASLMKESADLARLVFKNDSRMLAGFLNSVKWYEQDEEVKKRLEEEIKKIEGQS